MTKKERLETIIAHYSNGKPTVFAKFLGVAPSTISSWLSRDTYDYELLFAKCKDLDPSWLLTGEGEMLRSSTTDGAGVAEVTPSEKPKRVLQGGLPLIPIEAVAGWNGIDAPGVTSFDCVRYAIPEFEEAQADFLIRVSGFSMFPKYSSGDLLACRKIDEITFIQWGVIYVIDSRQGAMVKRLFESKDNPDAVLCVSDNEKYPPFQLPKSEIRSLSIVIGVIRLE